MNKKLIKVLTFMFLIAIITTIIPKININATPYGPLKVYILAGQSNMAGVGQVSDLPGELTDPENYVFSFVDGMVDPSIHCQWSILKQGLGVDSTKFGPELTFGLDLETARPDDRIALIKWSWGGTNLASDWNPSAGWCYNGGGPYSEYPGFKATVLQQIADLKNYWSEVEIAGMIWMQGESDSLDYTMANNYQTNLTNFIQAVRQDFGVPNMPFVIGRISDATQWTYRSTVRAAQANVADMVPNTSIINTDDLGRWQNDPYHYDSSGQITLGSRFAAAMESLTTSTWSFPQDFSSVYREKNWYYDEWNGTTYIPMTWSSDHWQGYYEYTRIYSGAVHPDTRDAALGWKAPNSGSVVISGNVKKLDLSGGDGVYVAIIKNGVTIWGYNYISYNDGTGLNFNFSTTVSQGDMIYFHTYKGLNNYFDLTGWSPQITLTWNN
ncbi:MAG: sialate O-acetylesterase [Saccharofermentanales bacterium]